jgi:predicted ester cyclase
MQQARLNKAIVRRFLGDAHAGRLHSFDELVAPDVVLHGFPGGDPRDRDEYKTFFAGLNAAFSAMRFDVLALVAEDDCVAARFRVRGEHRATYAGLAATGRAVDFGGMVLYRLSEGRIVETWLQPDNLSLLQQLGAVPNLSAA